MHEDFLHYVWRFQHFDKQNLLTQQGECITILHPGIPQEHAGPDFANASIRIQGVTWHGHVEVHMNTSDWRAHHHDQDPAYDNVILHVVWQDNGPIYRRDGTPLPTLLLSTRVHPQLLRQHKHLLNTPSDIPCASQMPKVKEITRLTMLEKALFQRLTHKNNLVYQLLTRHNNDWEATAYQLLAYNFGFKVNNQTFLDLTTLLPIKIIQRHYYDLPALEALLFGQAGLLDDPNRGLDSYGASLTEIYYYLIHKYEMPEHRLSRSQWKFFRLRPANFPTIRIAQFAQLLHQHQSMFALLAHTPIATLRKKLAIQQSSYWQNHYRFGKKSVNSIAGLGQNSIDNILINTAVPLLVAYGKFHDDQSYIDNAVAMLQQLPAEQNTVTRRWEQIGITVRTAFDSQALLELYNRFCTQKKCLSCNIGVSLVRNEQETEKPR